MPPNDPSDAEKEEFPLYLRMIMDKDFGILRELEGPLGIARRESVDPLDGPEESTIERRRKDHGSNELEPPEEATLFDMIKEAFQDKMVIVLMIAAVVSLALGLTVPDPKTKEVNYAEGWIEGTAILVSVFIVTVVSSLNEYQKEQKFKELSKSKPPRKVFVKRLGSLQQTRKVEIMSNELVQGDICHVKAGDDLTADGIFIEGQDLKLDESAVTGEGIELNKNEEDPFMVSGSSCIEGEGWMLVVGVGENSLSGQAEMKNREKKDPTPLQEKLDDLVDVISKAGSFMALLTFLVLVLKEVLTVHQDGKELDYAILVDKVVDSLTVAVTIIVVAVPEGLPLSVTIALAYSMSKMMEDNNLVRHLAACETMGGATNICSDKTGTLTQNRMTVVRAVLDGDQTVSGAARKVPVPDHINYKPELTEMRQRMHPDFRECLTQGACLNSTAFKDDDGNLMGNKTECAILEFIQGLGTDIVRVREKLGYERSKSQYDRHTYPFSSAKKRMITMHKLGGNMRIHVKGASEMVLADCTKIMSMNGRVEQIDEKRREQLKDSIAGLARQALRTLAVAYCEKPGEGRPDFPYPKEAPDERLTLLAILAIEDPIRPEVPEAVARCKRAGITVRMVTGDNKATAIAIAKQAGIYDPAAKDLAMEGRDFRNFDGDSPEEVLQMTYILSKLKVLARMTPVDKRILVQNLRSRGEIVAVTGDGTNDAPALKLANVGFAMLTGTEVAKAASDIILMDDNFASVVTAAKWGRNINDNIRKFIQFQSTVNIAAVVIAFLGSVFSAKGESPLKPVQLLWLNLIMDSMAALALATESPYPELLDRPPNFAGAPLISRRMWTNMLGQATYQIVLQLWLLHDGFKYFGVEEDSDEHMTIIFNVFVFLQVFNEFNARKLRDEFNIFGGLLRAKLFLVIIVITVVVQFAAVQYIGKMMGCVPLDIEQWKKCMILSVVPIPLGTFLRLLPVQEPDVPRPEVPTWVQRWRRTHRLYQPTGEGRGKAAFKAATKEVISQMKVAGALATLRRRRPRRNSSYQMPAAPH